MTPEDHQTPSIKTYLEIVDQKLLQNCEVTPNNVIAAEDMFRIYDQASDSEIYMLDDWGLASTESVAAWVASLKTGVPDTATTTHPVCPYDLDNLVWSGAAMRASVSLELWT